MELRGQIVEGIKRMFLLITAVHEEAQSYSLLVVQLQHPHSHPTVLRVEGVPSPLDQVPAWLRGVCEVVLHVRRKCFKHFLQPNR